MIRDTYKKIEQIVDQLDLEMESKHGANVQKILTNKYKFLENCTAKINDSNSSEENNKIFEKCLNYSDKFDIQPSIFLEKAKDLLYTCVNTSYQAAVLSKSDNLEKNYNISVEKCLQQFQKDVDQTIQNEIQQRLKLNLNL